MKKTIFVMAIMATVIIFTSCANDSSKLKKPTEFDSASILDTVPDSSIHLNDSVVAKLYHVVKSDSISRK
jgi:hypothetical protein